ncbi:hypothetical protein K474DRAFT_1654801 [Panus rudis PR-1116 ss-1]|nr:hypothetical protein K474DRAFT_1654801 [Panus rudis PR-1116 ss-1]
MLKTTSLSRIAQRSLRPCRLPRRCLSSGPKPPVKPDNSTQNVSFIGEQFAQNSAVAINYFKQFIKYTAVGLAVVGVTTWTALESAHMWVEKKELIPDNDPEVHKWEWDLEAERWTGGPSGGTDPGLGFKGRHAVRSAWAAQEWGIGSSGSVIGSSAYSSKGSTGGLSVVEARLEFAQDFLNIAIQIALKREPSGKLRPETVRELLQRHASVMEHMGTREALFEARSEFERVWSMLPGKGIDAARTALKIGDLNRRLGDNEEALAWWARAIQLTQDKDARVPIEIPPPVPQAMPSSPLAQRTLLSTLVSLSAYHATSGQLRQAQKVEEESLNLIRSVRQPESLDVVTPPQALHALYILHRSSLLSIHLAEVLYALRKKPTSSIEWLTRAAESSERVAFTLTGRPLTHPDAPQSKIPHPPDSETPLLPAYDKSNTLRKPARSLLRDSRRSAAEAWTLMGILAETSSAPDAKQRALEYYERALGWAGVSGDRAGGIGQPGEGTLEAEWNALWNKYVRVRNSIKEKEGSS